VWRVNARKKNRDFERANVTWLVKVNLSKKKNREMAEEKERKEYINNQTTWANKEPKIVKKKTSY